MRKFLFIRCDDVFRLEKSFLDFWDIMLAQRVPVIYGVIPAKLSKKAALFLKQAKEKQPELIDIVQHGYKHANHALPGGKKYEFGESRTYLQQKRDISEGMRIMRLYFGDFLTPGFIPPYHAEDERTIRVLEELKVPLYSARLKVPMKTKKFLDLPAQVWVNKVDIKGEPKPLNFRQVSADLFEALSALKVTGMVFRHHMMRTSHDKKVLMALMKLICKERDHGKLQIVLFSDLLKIKKDQT